jgi:hypothetical protein
MATPMVRVIGAEALSAILQHIKGEGGNQVGAAALRGAMVPLKKEIRRGVNTVRIQIGTTKKGKPKFRTPTALKSAARATIGSSVKRQVGGGYGAKAGFGVGKPTKLKKGRAQGRSYLGKIGTLSGVGLSAANIHWATLGTKKRHQKSGKSTGAMPAFLAGIVPRAARTARPAMLQAAASKAKIALKKEAAKRR